VYKLPVDGEDPQKNVGINKRFYYCLCHICISWFYKWEIWSQCTEWI